MSAASWRVASPGRPVVAIIGGGFAGAAVAMHLAKSARGALEIVVFDPSAALGRGVAYGSCGAHLLLNVPAGRLGCDPATPGGFLRWARAAGRRAEEGSFLPRSWFGEYVEHELESAVSAAARVRLTHVRDRIVRARCTSATTAELMTRCGGMTAADAVVLAAGTGPNRWPGAFADVRGDQRLLRSPWDAERMRDVAAAGGRVLLVGTGLTMVDAAVSLSRFGFAGEMTAVSRRGVVPATHAGSSPGEHAAWASDLSGDDLGALVRAIRERAGRGEWRSVMDSLRPHTSRLWAELSDADRWRFVSRLLPYWDAHRHRCPPETGAAISVLRERGALRVARARISGARARRRGIEVTFAGSRRAELFDAAILCTGPEPDPRLWGSRLIDALLGSGSATVDGLGFGLRTDAEGFAIERSGKSSAWLSVVGALRRADLWESTAAPELSRHAAALAGSLVERLDQKCGGGKLFTQEVEA